MCTYNSMESTCLGPAKSILIREGVHIRTYFRDFRDLFKKKHVLNSCSYASWMSLCIMGSQPTYMYMYVCNTTVQIVIFSRLYNVHLWSQIVATYSPPQDLTIVEPVYRESITPTQSSIYCREHGIKFSTKHFLINTNNKKTNKDTSSKSSDGEAATEVKDEIPVCIAAAMHLNISFPMDYVIVSPVCFVSCRCEKPCRATLELPHAAYLTKDNEKDKRRFCILSYVVTNMSSLNLKSPSPMGRVLDRLNVDSLEVENRLVRFKASFKNPSLYAVGIKSASGGSVPRPVVPLRCGLFCVYEKFDKHQEISIVNVKMFVGLSLQTVTQVHIHMYIHTYVHTYIDMYLHKLLILLHNFCTSNNLCASPFDPIFWSFQLHWIYWFSKSWVKVQGLFNKCKDCVNCAVATTTVKPQNLKSDSELKQGHSFSWYFYESTTVEPQKYGHIKVYWLERCPCVFLGCKRSVLIIEALQRSCALGMYWLWLCHVKPALWPS